MKTKRYTRREILELGGLVGLGFFALPTPIAFIPSEQMESRIIPSSGEKMPIVGLGTWRTFDVGESDEKKGPLRKVLTELNRHGGRFVDSSPMYGSSESVVGELTAGSSVQNEFFYATKVWTSGREEGIRQMQNSMERMRRKKMDLFQIHNLLDWQTHVKTLRDWKENEKIRYWGITHYLDSEHSTLETIIESEKPDFLQCNYSIRSRNAEKSLFDTAKKNKTAVIINRPFEGGSLFSLTKNRPLPGWCADFDISSWAQYFLKFILADTRVTCVIPGTSKPHHMIDNALAGYGKLPDEKTRKKMIDDLV